MNYKIGMENFIGRSESRNLYAQVVVKLNQKMSLRLKCALSALVAKVSHIFTGHYRRFPTLVVLKIEKITQGDCR